MPIGVGTAMVAGSALNALGSAFGGDGGAHDDRKERRRQFNEQFGQQKREFWRQQGLEEGQQAIGTQRQLDMAPLRDRLLHTLNLRAGLAPAPMQAHDMFNPGPMAGNRGPQTPQLGGIDMQAMQQGMAGYQPGQGGVNTGPAQQLMNSLGYGGQPNGPGPLIDRAQWPVLGRQSQGTQAPPQVGPSSIPGAAQQPFQPRTIEEMYQYLEQQKRARSPYGYAL